MPTKSTDGLILKLNIAITYLYNKIIGGFESEKQRERNHANSVDNHNNSNVNSSRSSSNSSNPKQFTSELLQQQETNTKQHMKMKVIWVK